MRANIFMNPRHILPVLLAVVAAGCAQRQTPVPEPAPAVVAEEEPQFVRVSGPAAGTRTAPPPARAAEPPPPPVPEDRAGAIEESVHNGTLISREHGRLVFAGNRAVEGANTAPALFEEAILLGVIRARVNQVSESHGAPPPKVKLQRSVVTLSVDGEAPSPQLARMVDAALGEHGVESVVVEFE